MTLSTKFLVSELTQDQEILSVEFSDKIEAMAEILRKHVLSGDDVRILDQACKRTISRMHAIAFASEELSDLIISTGNLKDTDTMEAMIKASYQGAQGIK